MPRFRSIFAAAILALSSTAPAHARLHPLVDTVRRAGVNIIVSDNCPLTLEGSYHAGTRTMVLCNNNARSSDAAFATFTHEAVHVLQDCMHGPGIGDGITNTIARAVTRHVNPSQGKQFARTIVNSLGDHGLNHVIDNYRTADLGMEAEAYALQNDPDRVNHLLSLCTGR